MRPWRASRGRPSRVAVGSFLTGAVLILSACLGTTGCAAIGYTWAVDLTVTLDDSWDPRDGLAVDVECQDPTPCVDPDPPEPTTVDGVWQGRLDAEPSRVLVTVSRDGDVLAEVPVDVRYLRDRGPCPGPRQAVATVEDPDERERDRSLVPGADLLEP